MDHVGIWADEQYHALCDEWAALQEMKKKFQERQNEFISNVQVQEYYARQFFPEVFEIEDEDASYIQKWIRAAPKYIRKRGCGYIPQTGVTSTPGALLIKKEIAYIAYERQMRALRNKIRKQKN